MLDTPLEVFVVHWRAQEWLRRSVDSIVQSVPPVKLTVVNNGTASSLPLALPAEVRVVHTGRNLGFAGAANLGIRKWLAGRDDFCVVASHDLLVSTDAFRLLVDAAKANPTFGILGPELTNNFIDKPRVVGEKLTERSFVSGGCMLLRRECVLTVGAFDERFSSYGEDDDLCIRAAAAGWRLGTVNGLKVETMGTSAPLARQRRSTAARIALAHKYSENSKVSVEIHRALRRAARLVTYGRPFRSAATLAGITQGIFRLLRTRTPPSHPVASPQREVHR